MNKMEEEKKEERRKMSKRLIVEYGVSEEDDTWAEYGLIQKHLSFKGENTGYKGIEKSSNLIAIVRKGYTLVPNELVKEKVIPYIEDLGYSVIREENWTKRGTGFLAYVARDEKIDMKGEPMRFGMTIMNSEDGTIPFTIEGFSFREICKNGAMLGIRKEGKFSRKHLGSIETILKFVQDQVPSVVKAQDDVINKYRAMMTREVTPEQFGLLDQMLPKKIKPEELRVGGNQWLVYNEMTERIWHNTKGTGARRVALMNVVNTVMMR